jgi:LuxR family transcriptional regulator, maltose regulon positive regulatory protein
LTVASAVPRLIDPGDLVAALDRAVVAGKVTVISAPAGSGKTSLLRAWAGRPGQPRRLAVLQVHRDQQDAQHFWLALLDTVRQGTVSSATSARPARPPNARSLSPRPTGWCCRSR